MVCSIQMRTVPLLAVLLATIGAGPQDELVRARQLYNQQLYNLAIDSATAARRTPQLADAATLVVARSLLERFRREAAPADLEAARTELQQIHPAGLSPSDQVELVDRARRAAVPGRPAGRGRRGVRAGARPRRSDSRHRASASSTGGPARVDRQAHCGRKPNARRSTRASSPGWKTSCDGTPASAVASYWLVAGSARQRRSRTSVGRRVRGVGASVACGRPPRAAARRPRSDRDAGHHPRTRAPAGTRRRRRTAHGRDARRVGRAQAGVAAPERRVGAQRFSNCAASAAALSASCSANTKFFAFIASSACSVNRFAMSYCACASTLSAR